MYIKKPCFCSKVAKTHKNQKRTISKIFIIIFKKTFFVYTSYRNFLDKVSSFLRFRIFEVPDHQRRHPWLWIPEYFCCCIRNDDQSNQIKHLTWIPHKLRNKLLAEKAVKLVKNVTNHQNAYDNIFITIMGDSITSFGLTLNRILWSRHHQSTPPYFLVNSCLLTHFTTFCPKGPWISKFRKHFLTNNWVIFFMP